MNLDLQTLLEFPKILSEHNESEVRVERKLLEKNYTDTKTGSYVVQLGSSTLILSKTNNFPCSEWEAQEIINQLNKLEEQKKLYNQILEKKDPLASSEVGILVRGGSNNLPKNPDHKRISEIWQIREKWCFEICRRGWSKFQ